MVKWVEIGNARLALGDCRELLPTVGAVDAVVTDPPYGIGIDPGNHERGRGYRPYDRRQIAHDMPLVFGDHKPFNPVHLLAYNNCILWGANNYANKLPASSSWLAWDRKAAKAADSSITDCELAWVRGVGFKTVRLYSHMWAGFQRDSEAGEKHLHPTQKPIALFEWCLGFFPAARTIADPYMGAGACGVACARLGRRFIGIEIEPRYFDIACRRIENAYKQADLFVEQPIPEDPAEARLRDLFAEPEA